jgi:hypothetical protein
VKFLDKINQFIKPGSISILLLILSVLTFVPGKIPAASNPAILYSFDENQGAVANDTSGSANNGSLVNGPTWVAGKYNSGINFDGANDYVNAGSGATIDQLPQVTAMAWIYPRTAGEFTSGDFFNKRGSNGSGWKFDINSNRLELSFSVDYTTDLVVVSNISAISLNRWSHVAVVWDGTPAASNVKIYVDGVEVAHSSDVNATGTRANDSNNNLLIGNNVATDQTFNGVIDEARVYNRALTQAEIQDDMNTPIGGPPGPAPDVVGQWSSPFSTPVLLVHTTLLHTGEVLIWGAASAGVNQWLWDPATGIFTQVTSGDNQFCSGQTVLPDGRAMSIGGHANYQVGIKDINLFDPASRSWSAAPRMNYGRWYPTGTALGDGKVLVTSGNTTCGTCLADIPEVYDPNANSWTQLTAAQYTQPTYPYMFLLPDGKVLYSGSDSSHTITRTLDVQNQTWATVDSAVVPGGSAAMYLPGKILKSGSNANGGGTVPSLNSAYLFDAAQPAPTWRQVGSMAEPRTYHTLTVLPDGTVLATSGVRTTVNTSNIPSLSAEVWNPQTETWTQLSSAQVKRAYHSIALLLPDGRVLVSGSGGDAAGLMTNELNAEIFSPPYLFKGPRPTITTVPATMEYGSTYAVSTPNASTIASVSLVRSGAVTHTFNNDQRYVPLAFTQNGSGGLDIQIPANSNILPPGYYMLFIVDQSGVPSVASFVNVQPVVDTQPPTDPTNLASGVSADSVNLTWTGSTDNVAVTGYDVHRSTSSGFTPSTANKIAQVTSAAYTDSGLASGTYYYKVIARDGSGNVSGPSNESSAAINIAQPITVSFAPTSSDGRVGYFGPLNAGCSQAQWDNAHMAAIAQSDSTDAVRSSFVSSGCLGNKAVSLTRGFLSFDTSTLPDTAVITSARLKLYVTGKLDSKNDGNDFVSVVEGRQGSPTFLSNGDYVNAGDSNTNPTEGSNRVDITSIAINAYASWTLNATGYSWISKTGYSNFALREGHDILNLWPAFASGQGNALHVAMSEQTGTNQDPVLEITYIIP